MIFDQPIIINEEAIFNKKNKNPVYIVLMHSGTPLANAIKKVTGDEFSHACISFNSKLDPLYSFGTKGKGQTGVGFAVNDPKDAFFNTHNAKYSVYVMYVTDNALSRMKKRLSFFKKNEATLKYDFVGLFDIWFGKDSEDHEKWFCSRFVMELISKAQQLSKVPSLWKPSDITDLQNISLVNRGFNFYNYNYKITEKHCNHIKKGTYDPSEVVYEDAIIEPISEANTSEGVQSLLDNTSKSHIWVTSDWHIFRSHHTDRANFVNGKEIVQWCKNKFNKDDVLLYLGDISFREDFKEDKQEAAIMFSSIPGTKILIKGNHDLLSNNKYIEDFGFSYVMDDLTYDNILFTHHPVDMNSYPEEMVNCHGHIHETRTFSPSDSGRNINVYPYLYGNKPITLKFIKDNIDKLKSGNYKGLEGGR